MKLGDSVIGSDGLRKKVTHLHPISELDIWEVKTRDGRTTYCNDEHLWPLITPRNTNERVLVTPLKDFKDNYSSVRFDKRDGREGVENFRFLPLPKAVSWKKRELLVDPYMFGVWLGDGSKEGGLITSADPEIFDWFNLPVKKRLKDKYNYRVEGFTTLLSKLGVLRSKRIPIDYLFSSINDRLALLQGLMDTDGTIHQDGKIAYFCNTNWNLIEGVIHLVRSLGGVAALNENVTMCNGKYFDSWRVSVKLPKDFNPFRMRRKADRWVYDEINRVAISSIQKVERANARCITVDGGLYLTDDFLVTHNSSAGTLAFVLAAVCFGFRDFVLIVSATEKQAIDHLQEIKIQLEENESLREAFQIHGLSKDNEAELICHVGERVFKVVAKGASQKLRGIKWRNKRPNLFVIDDLEDDEAVRSKEQREKLAHWFTSALLPAGSDEALFRMFGTILHADSLLAGLLKSESWLSRTYRAHAAFDDFSEILWPEKFPEHRLRMLRQQYIDKHNPSGYSQEMLNVPLADTDRYFRPEWFISWKEEDRGKPMRFYSAIDFAISQSDRADRTAIVTVGILPDDRMVFVDVRAGRWDALEIIQQMFEVHEIFEPDLFVAENGAIQKSIGPFLNAEMLRTGTYINVVGRTPTKDKQSRARSIQARFRAGSVLCDTEAEWYPDFYEEMISFPRGEHDDRVDAASWIGLELANLSQPLDLTEIEEEDYAWEEFKDGLLNGRCVTTGY